MKREDTLPAGPALDAAVARVVFGREVCLSPVKSEPWAGVKRCETCGRIAWKDERHLPAPPYSTDWGAAGQVVEEMMRRGWHYEVREAYDSKRGMHVAGFSQFPVGRSYSVKDHTAPLAIARAALRALQEAPCDS